MITTFEKAIQKSTTRARLSVHHTSFLWAFARSSCVRRSIVLLHSGGQACPSRRFPLAGREPAASGGLPRSRSHDRGGCSLLPRANPKPARRQGSRQAAASRGGLRGRLLPRAGGPWRRVLPSV